MDLFGLLRKMDLFGIVLPGTIVVFVVAYLLFGVLSVLQMPVEDLLNQQFLLSIVFFVFAYLMGSLLRMFAADDADEASSKYLEAKWRKEHPDKTKGANMAAYKKCWTALAKGEDISESEIRDLARLLEGQVLHVTEDRLRKVYDHKTARFIQFIRHILGLERLESWSETVTSAFDEFIAQHTTFSALQIRFLQTLKTFILQTGKVERENLIAQPFTNLHPQGIRGLFEPYQIQEIMTFVGEIGQQAA